MGVLLRYGNNFSDYSIMASSDYDTYGNLKIKSVLLDAPSGLVFHDPNDDSKSVTLKATGLGSGNVDIQLPTAAGTLLTTGSSVTLQAGDIDNSNLFAANVVDSNALASNAVSNVNIAADASIAKSKLASLAIVDADVAANASIAKSKLAALDIANADVAANAAIAGSKVLPAFGNQNVLVGQAQAFYFGSATTDGSWRMKLSGGDIVWEKRESGTWNQKGSFTA